MALTANTHIQLNVSKPKKDATIAQGTITLGANEVAIKLGTLISLSNPQQIVGDLEKLYRFAKTNIKNYTSDTVFSITPGGADNDIVTTGHTTSLISLYVDSLVLTGDRSHFLHRTYKRLVELLLEEAK